MALLSAYKRSRRQDRSTAIFVAAVRRARGEADFTNGELAARLEDLFPRGADRDARYDEKRVRDDLSRPKIGTRLMRRYAAAVFSLCEKTPAYDVFLQEMTRLGVARVVPIKADFLELIKLMLHEKRSDDAVAFCQTYSELLAIGAAFDEAEGLPEGTTIGASTVIYPLAPRRRAS